ncbi:MAG: DUF2341 domain-containing protein [Fibrobacterota bacterium]|nr:DUF2341 domain-containing protein [Fibrobacterota bacterium]QQS05400.1 MAG: DUF2341 domain-containing protein [Fibrobacterota bacterium]
MNKLLAALVFCGLLGCGLDKPGVAPSSGNGTSTDNVLTRKLRIDSILSDLPPGDSGPYPMLVRFDSSSLPFEASWQDGRDFRVFLDDTVPLAHFVRDWNASARHASAWVRLPSYFGHRRILTVRVGRDSLISRSNKAATWDGVSEWMRTLTSSVNLAEFEVDSIIPMTPCRCNQWYVGRSKNSSIGPTTGIEAAAKGRNGRAFHLSYNTPAGDWTVLGTRLGTGIHRLGGLDSIVFWARGNGSIKVALEDFRDTSDYSKAWKTIALDTAWKRYSVPPSTFDANEPYSIGWEGVKNRITTISFFGHTGSDFWIDGISLKGISPAEIP